MADAAFRISQQATRRLDFMPAFRHVKASQRPPSCVAVDGSHAVLADNGFLWVVAVRAEAVVWPGPKLPEVDPAIFAATPDEARAIVEQVYSILGAPAPPIRSAESFAEAMRAADETSKAIVAARRGGLLLIDGAVEGLPPGPAALISAIRAAVTTSGGRLVGVAKRSGLEHGGAPVVSEILRLGTESMPKQAWAAPVPGMDGVWVAKLHGASLHAFRIDCSADYLPGLAALSRDAVYAGYPYPLALAHNRVALTAGHVKELRGRLDAEVRRVGGGAAAGQVRDFHAVLDRSVPG